MFGWSKDEAIGALVSQLIIPLTAREAHWNWLSKFMAGDVPQHGYRRLETTGLHRNGKHIAVEVSYNPIRVGGKFHFTAFINDVTERKGAEEQLALFRRVFDACKECVCIADSRGNMLYQNPATSSELGFADHDMAGQYYTMGLSAGSAAASADAIRQAIIDGHDWSGRLIHKCKDGRELETWNNIGFITDERGQVQYIFNIFSDISADLRRERELAAAKEQAERANHAKSDFLSSMSHELRTPLNSVLGFAQLLACDDGLDEDQRDSANEIVQGGRHLLTLINDVLDLAAVEAGHLELAIAPVPLAELVQECLKLAQPLAAPGNITIALDVDAEVIVQADPMRLKQILLNLLSNAIKYNRPSGWVRLSATRGTQGMIKVAISDNGQGIAADRADDLFVPFSRLHTEKRRIEGTGMGLTITRRLVEAMGGTIGFASTPGEGSLFWVALPAGGGLDGSLPLPYRASAPDYAETSGHVLCIDDNPANLKLAMQALQYRPNITVDSATDAATGLERARRRLPGLIVLDIHMPGMNGYDALKVIREDHLLRAIPVIAVSAGSMPHDLTQAERAGFACYLTKPLDISAFITAIDRILIANTGGPK